VTCQRTGECHRTIKLRVPVPHRSCYSSWTYRWSVGVI